jgi:hypothetical protein
LPRHWNVAVSCRPLKKISTLFVLKLFLCTRNSNTISSLY